MEQTIKPSDFVEYVGAYNIKRGFVLAVRPQYAEVQYFLRTSKTDGSQKFIDQVEEDLIRSLKLVPDFQEEKEEDLEGLIDLSLLLKEEEWFHELLKRAGELK